MTTGNTKLAARLRDMAKTLQKDIDERRRAEIAASIREDARRMEKVQAALIGLARAHERDDVPEVLAEITTKKQVEHLVHLYKPSLQQQAQKDALLALCDLAAGQLTAADKIKELERQLVGRKIDGFFPTPAEIVKLMLRYADIQPGDRVLETSADKGNIADLVHALHPSANLDVIECNSTLREILYAKNHILVEVDCLDYHNLIYNVVVMNPPFEHLADIDHVLHAYNHCLKAGGRLVSVMGERAFFRSDKKALAFRAWLAEVGGGVIDLPAGAFKESGTGVKTRIIIVDKAGGETSLTQTQTSESSETDLALVVGEVMEFINQLMEAETEEELPTLEAIENALPTTVIISPDGEPEETSQPLPQTAQEEPQAESAQTAQERGIQKGLPGLGDDKLLKLRQVKLF